MALLYTPLKIFHFREKLKSLPREIPEITPPIHIRIKPTNVCNQPADIAHTGLRVFSWGRT